jgi:hypothetical protein
LAQDLGPGFRLAGLLALMTATAFASGWAILETLAPTPPWSTRPLLSLGIAAWAAWLLAAVAHVAAPDRWYRWAAGLAVLVTAGVVPAAALTGLLRPPLFVLLPQLVLGVVALGAAGRHPRWVRLLPVAAAAVGVLVAAPGLENFYSGYYFVAPAVLPAAAVMLLVGAALLALGLAARRDYRGAWALLVLLTPIGMLAMIPLGGVLDGTLGRAPVPAWPFMALAAVLVAVVGPALVALAVAVRRRPPPGVRSLGADAGRCPTCGAPSTSA